MINVCKFVGTNIMINKNREVEKTFFSNSFKTWLKEDYYTILGIKSNANEDEIAKAFKKEVKSANPNLYPKDSISRKYAELKLKHLIEIREILLDTDKRNEYDFQRQLSQDCYLDYMISSSRLIDKDIKKEDDKKKSGFLDKYINQDMRIYNISQTEIRTLDEIYQFCKSTTLFN